MIENGFAKVAAGDWLMSRAQPVACGGRAAVGRLKGFLVPDRGYVRAVTTSAEAYCASADAPFLSRLDALPDEPLKLVSAKLFGPEEEYKLLGEEKLPMPAVRSGKGWSVDCPMKVVDPKRPKVFCWGDSIMLGYSPALRRVLDGRAYVYSWCGFCTDPEVKDWTPWIEASGVEAFDFVVFNNGLHSLHWKEGAISDVRVEACYRGLIQAFRKGAPKAKLVYLTTTPLLKQMPAGEKPDGFNPGNAVVQRLNRLATKVMQEEGVEVLDLYTIMSAHLDYANGGNDIYHWTKDKGYPLIAESISYKLFGK